ncbi:hypothetical protein [Ruminococcus albus]|uniref:Uncharacterized protein n=1 Tax=Ruminococcus albus TaxID=1264 RepID=A0A1H7JLS0_RUMAL|nr:hypothetical protein [Ruminococcus albus]SEK75296.1 hypothetical protein SAMN05216469_105112 [Ruminococcus albus]
MTRQDIIKNIDIARRYMNEYHLLLPDDEVLFDCYCLPSFRWKAFYAQVSAKNGVYIANCAYTRYADHLGNESYSRHFTAAQNDTHPAIRNDIFCKTVFPEHEIVDDLISEVSEYSAKTDDTENGMMIDGITAGIRLFENGSLLRDIVLDNPNKPEPLLDAICYFSDMI